MHLWQIFLDCNANRSCGLSGGGCFQKSAFVRVTLTIAVLVVAVGVVCGLTTLHLRHDWHILAPASRPRQQHACRQVFWESHDPTQGMRQGRDVGSQYRSAIFTYTDEHQHLAETSRDSYQQLLAGRGHGAITTEIKPASEFYYAEDYHQQYLHKNPTGYCGLGGTGVTCAF